MGTDRISGKDWKVGRGSRKDIKENSFTDVGGKTLQC